MQESHGLYASEVPKVGGFSPLSPTPEDPCDGRDPRCFRPTTPAVRRPGVEESPAWQDRRGAGAVPHSWRVGPGLSRQHARRRRGSGDRSGVVRGRSAGRHRVRRRRDLPAARRSSRRRGGLHPATRVSPAGRTRAHRRVSSPLADGARGARSPRVRRDLRAAGVRCDPRRGDGRRRRSAGNGHWPTGASGSSQRSSRRRIPS